MTESFSFASTFNIVTGLYLFFFVASIVLGVFVYTKNQGNLVSRIFLLLAIASAFLQFGEIFFSWSPFKEDAFFFTSIKSIGFVFWWPLSLHLFLLMRNLKTSRPWKIILTILYAYSFVCVLSFFLGISHAEDYIRKGIVWIDIPYWSAIGIPYLLMIPTCLFLDFYLLGVLLSNAKKNSDVLLQKQAKLMLCTGIPLSFIGLTFNIILPNFGVVVPSIGHLFFGFWILVLGIAIVKYRFLVPTLEFASRQIFTIAGEMIVVTDLQFRITEYNNAFSNAVGNKPLTNVSLVDIIKGIDEALLTNSPQASIVVGLGQFVGSENHTTYIKIKRSFLFDNKIMIGAVFVLSDITDLRNMNEDLEKKVALRTQELEKEKSEAERRLAITEVYTRRSIVNVIGSGGDPRTFSPLNRKMAVLFSDIRNFTGIAEGLSPLETVEILNSYFDQMNDSILKNDGEIDKLIGDCIMSIHIDADSALRAAIGMRLSLKKFNETRSLDIRVNNGIGINFGEVIVGNIGSVGKMDYTVIGDIVNTASRIEALTKYYQLPILISEDVKTALNNEYQIRFVDNVLVKGRKTPVRLYECFDHETDEVQQSKLAIEDELQYFYSLYSNGDFTEALKGYTQLQKEVGPHNYIENISKDPMLNFYATRCQNLLEQQKAGFLENWNGIYEFLDK